MLGWWGIGVPCALQAPLPSALATRHKSRDLLDWDRQTRGQSSRNCCLARSYLTTGTGTGVSLCLLRPAQPWDNPTSAPPMWSFPVLPMLSHRVTGQYWELGEHGDCHRKNTTSAPPGRAPLGRMGLQWGAPPTGHPAPTR